MKQQQRKALALVATLAFSSWQVAAQAAPHGAAARNAAARSAQAANAAADAGYKAFARREYANAVEHAQRAVQLAPERRDYWLLLAQAHAGNRQIDQAEQALNRAAAGRGHDQAMARVRTDLTRMRAQAAGEAMYKALQADDVKAAITAGTEAVRWAPENAGYRLVLVQALLRDGRFADADRVAGETIALLPDSAAPLALRGYAREGLGRPADASADLDRALRQRNVQAAAQRQLRLLAADLALAQGNGQRAIEMLAALPAEDADAAGPARARPPAHGRHRARALRAASSRHRLFQRRRLADLHAAGRGLAAAAGLRQRHGRLSRPRRARRAPRPGPVAPGCHRQSRPAGLAVDAHERSACRPRVAGGGAGRHRGARAALRSADAGPALLDPPPAGQRPRCQRGCASRTGLGPVAGDHRGGPARRPGPQARGPRAPGRRSGLESRHAAKSSLDTAYLSARIGDDEAARQAFAQADANGGLPPTSLLDAGYAAMHSRHDDEAVAYFKRAVDAANGLQLRMDPQMLYDTRRTIAEVSRKWGVLASVTLRNGSGVAPNFGVVGGGGSPGERTTQAGVEAYYRPWGFRNGQFVELFVRGFTTLDSQGGGNTGADSFAGGVGVRWKPLTAQNFVLSLSRTFGPNVTGDWLAQLGWSWDYGNDLRVDVDSWWTARYYAEIGRYLSQGIDYGIASAMMGRSYVVSADHRTIAFPHVFAGIEYTSNEPVAKTAAGIGPGITLRRWFREDVYDAPRSYFDLTVQYRARITGDDRMQGLFVNGLLSY